MLVIPSGKDFTDSVAETVGKHYAVGIKASQARSGSQVNGNYER